MVGSEQSALTRQTYRYNFRAEVDRILEFKNGEIVVEVSLVEVFVDDHSRHRNRLKVLRSGRYLSDACRASV